jgi:protein arginine kinase activator
MQCERCNKKKATVFYRENIGGRVRALRLCGECAETLEEAGELEDMSVALSGILSPLFRGEEGFLSLPFHGVSPGTPRGAERKCPLCGAGYAELAAVGKVGCPACYTAFSDELSDVIRAVHGRREHRGRLSAGYRARQDRLSRLEVLRLKLKQAIEAEEYELAAGLRDEIRSLEAAL